jgi:predicted small integral membrane protein
MDFSWMAWTRETVIFFATIFFLIFSMGIWERFSPGGGPRVGILRFETTRGDRLFISLLGSAYIHLLWLGLVGTMLWWAMLISVVYMVCVFKWV